MPKSKDTSFEPVLSELDSVTSDQLETEQQRLIDRLMAVVDLKKIVRSLERIAKPRCQQEGD